MTSARDTDQHVVRVFLRNAGEVLLLRRSDAVGTDSGAWDAVSGGVEGDPAAAARWEIDEKTGLAGAVTFVRRGPALTVTDESLGTRWVVHPFLFDCNDRDVVPNEEVDAAEWVPAPEIRRREAVPDLWAAYDRVRPTAEAIESDTEHGSAWLSLRALEVLRDEASLAVETESRAGTWDDVASVATRLLDARPSMTALVNRVNRAMSEADGRVAGVERVAHAGIERALAADRRASETAASRVAGETVLTLSRSGTVERALSLGTDRPAHVYVAESRPAREGVGVAERLASDGLDVTLITDAAVAHVLSGGLRSEIDRVVVGADTVHPDGSVVNKTGTRATAIAAAYESIPVEVVTATDKVATRETVEGESGPSEAVYGGDVALRVANPTFDRTPAAVVDQIVTERGVLRTDRVRDVVDELRTLAGWRG